MTQKLEKVESIVVIDAFNISQLTREINLTTAGKLESNSIDRTKKI